MAVKAKRPPIEYDRPIMRFVMKMNKIEKRYKDLEKPAAKIIHCPECSWVMPLAPWQSMIWCPCGWRA